VIVAVLAGGRGSRLGGAKACVELGGTPLISRVLAAAAGLEAVARLAPERLDLAPFGDPARPVASINTPEDLAEARV
jgi:molybdopterin-guanine dinucleotide biosynthesis protein A